jgi:5-methylcytosine-specific restriction endonuclease McrA
MSLDSPTLVLNKNWIGINATTVKDAINTVCSERARIVCPEDYNLYYFDEWMKLDVPTGHPFIKTQHGKVKCPEVIVLNDYGQIPRQTVVFSRRNLWRRDLYRCQYCGKRPPPDEITIDHIVPKARGGMSCFENCVLACIDCNLKKGHKPLHKTGMRLRRSVKNHDGSESIVFYTRPSVPSWSPLYSVRRHKIPQSWSKFLKDTIDYLYWNIELET